MTDKLNDLIAKFIPALAALALLSLAALFAGAAVLVWAEVARMLVRP